MFRAILKKLRGKEGLTVEEAKGAFDCIFDGKISEDDLVSFLVLLRDKGESVGEITGAVASLRKRAVRLPCKSTDLIDTCGTGGDCKNTFNISTASAFVVAGAGVRVAKHGNVAVSSKSGSADVMKACGVNVEAMPEVVARCVDEVGIGFMFAPVYHKAVKQASSARKKIGTKTIFNIMGPLLNPAGAKKQVVGVYHERLLPIVADVLRDLGVASAAVVHGDDGLDELTMTTTSKIVMLKDGIITSAVFSPAEVGYPFCKPADLEGASAEENAKRLRKMLKGHSQAVDHCVHLNAALALIVAGKAGNFREALLLVQESVSSGEAFRKLEALADLSNI